MAWSLTWWQADQLARKGRKVRRDPWVNPIGWITYNTGLFFYHEERNTKLPEGVASVAPARGRHVVRENEFGKDEFEATDWTDAYPLAYDDDGGEDPPGDDGGGTGIDHPPNDGGKPPIGGGDGGGGSGGGSGGSGGGGDDDDDDSGGGGDDDDDDDDGGDDGDGGGGGDDDPPPPPPPPPNPPPGGGGSTGGGIDAPKCSPGFYWDADLETCVPRGRKKSAGSTGFTNATSLRSIGG
ncbi:MAG: hypothetical protein ABMA13_18965 [Chthoniobacteraceae bacterium]